MGLLLEGEADCLNHQHNHRRHWPPIRRQSRAAAPYRASGLVLSAIPAVGATIRQRQLWSALLTSSIRSGRTAGFCASGGQKTTHLSHSGNIGDCPLSCRKDAIAGAKSQHRQS
jgi:hypothetical protein